ncbi:MAG: metallophosphoesterase [Planctomycetaceae bacterium]|nr:metallophosphoesterase [Planctomycetaceae bacterium]
MRSAYFKVFFTFTLVLSGFLAADEAKWSFVIGGDSRGNDNGINAPVLGEIAGEIVRQKADFVVVPGDLVSGGLMSSLKKQFLNWRKCMEPVYRAGIGVYPVRGNHDVRDSEGTKAWKRVFSGSYRLPSNGPANQRGLTYSVEHRNALLIGLDQYVVLNRVDQRWLDAQLSANRQPHVFVFGHAPAFGLDHNDCLDDHPEERDAFWASLKKAGCRMYICGHDHFFDHAQVDDGDGNPLNDIDQYVVGTAGAPLKNWDPPYKGPNGGKVIGQLRHEKEFGYVLVEVLNDWHYRTTWYGRAEGGRYVAGASHDYISQPVAQSAETALQGASR